jgi:hypothetical protein
VISDAIAAAAHTLGERAVPVLARLAGPIGADARARFAELAALPDAARKVRRAESCAIARAPVPVGLRAVHPSWIEAALAPLPPGAREAVARGGGEPVDVWLARWATAAIPPIAIDRATAWSTAPRSVDDVLAARSADDLVEWLRGVGADQLACAASLAGPAAVRELERRWDKWPALHEAHTRIHQPPRAGRLGPTRAVLARCHLVLHGAAELQIGARAIAPYVAARALLRQQLVFRMPRDAGAVVDAGLGEYATHPIGECPAWAAVST